MVGITTGFFGRFVRHLAGWVYLFIRYGKKRKEILQKEYNGSYAVAGGELFLQTIAIIWIVLIIGILCALIFQVIKYFF